MAFTNDVVGGITLVREAIRSPNYVANISGWTINRDGTAEFASGTFRGPIVVIESGTGTVLASIGANGNASFKNVNVETDILLGNISLLDFFESTGFGIVGFWDTVGALPAPGNGVFTSTAFVNSLLLPTRVYCIHARPMRINNSGFADAANDTQWIYRVTNRPGVTITFGGSRQTIAGGATLGDTLYQRAYFADNLGDGTASYELQSKGSTANITYTNVGGWGLIVYDIGPLSVLTGLGGGTGAPAGVIQRTTTYTCLDSRSYDSSGNPIVAPDRDNNVYQGTFPDRTYGNERSIVIFDGATIRTDLTGATIQSAKLWLYCIKAEETNGSLGYAGATNSSVPATLASPASDDFGYDDDWPLPGWHSVSALDSSGNGTLVAQIQGGDNSITLGPTLFGLAATGFAGFGAGATTRPYLEITYTK